jgi:hypothetical protein
VTLHLRIVLALAALALLWPCLAAADDADQAQRRTLRALEDGAPGEDRWQRSLRPLVIARYDRVFITSSPFAAVAFGVPLFVTSLRDPYDLPLQHVMMPGMMLLDALCTIGFGAVHAGMGFALRTLVLGDLDGASDRLSLAMHWTRRGRILGIIGILGVGASAAFLLAPMHARSSPVDWRNFLGFGALASLPFVLIAESVAHAELAKLASAGEVGDASARAARRGPRLTALGPLGIAGVW